MRWPTGWAARRPARSPRGWRPRPSSPPSAAPSRPRPSCAPSSRARTARSTRSPSTTRAARAWERRSPPRCVEGDEISIGHVGDSRAYRFRDGELKLLTSDHSLVEELRRQGRLTEEEAETHPQRSIITRALGPEAEVEVDTLTVSARPDDVYLICSDGLTTMVKDVKVREILAESSSLDEATTWLVNEANEAGGRDNITVVAFRLGEGEAQEVDEGATLVGPTAAGAGLSADAVRTEAERRRAAEPGRRRLRARRRAAASRRAQAKARLPRQVAWSRCS